MVQLRKMMRGQPQSRPIEEPPQDSTKDSSRALFELEEQRSLLNDQEARLRTLERMWDENLVFEHDVKSVPGTTRTSARTTPLAASSRRSRREEEEAFLDENEDDVSSSTSTKDDTDDVESLKKQEQNKNGEDDDDDKETLGHSTFSFITATPIGSAPFLLALGVSFVKNFMLWMMLTDILLPDTGSFKDMFPDMVSSTVFLSQVISYALAGLTSNDFVLAFSMLYHPYPLYNPPLTTVFPNAGTWPQWMTTTIVALIDGTNVLLASFILVATSDTAFDVFLNFAAVAFISELDEAFFVLCQKEFLGQVFQRATEQVATGQFELVVKSPTQRDNRSRVRKVLFWVVVVCTMMAGIVIYILQNKGFFAPTYLYVQWDDNVRSELSLHSGYYQWDGIQSRKGNARSFVYVEERQGGNARIAYCLSRAKWTIVIPGGPDNASSDPCDPDSILAESTKTKSLKVLDTAGDDWYAKVAGGPQGRGARFLPLEDFYMAKGCDTSGVSSRKNGRRSKSGDGECGYGVCGSDERCDCSGTGYTGIQCQFEINQTCTFLAVDENVGEQFPIQRGRGSIKGAVAPTFELWQSDDGNGFIEYYERPVYYNRKNGDFVFFTGLRWVISNLDFVLPNSTQNTNVTTSTTKVSLLEQFVKVHASKLEFFNFASQKVVFRTEDDTDNTPNGLTWSTPVPENAKEEPYLSKGNAYDLVELSDPYRFLCARCSADDDGLNDICQNGGTCNPDTNRCVCVDGAQGQQCEVPPTANGQCNRFFNTEAYGFDGGDCCLATCSSTATQPCGVSTIVGSNPLYTGFDSCRVEALQKEKISKVCADDAAGGGRCYLQDASFTTADSTTDPMLWLSSNGNTMIVVDNWKGFPFAMERPAGSATWVHRGPFLPKRFGYNDIIQINFLEPPSHMIGKQKEERLPIGVSFLTDEGISVYRTITNNAYDEAWEEIGFLSRTEVLPEHTQVKMIKMAGDELVTNSFWLYVLTSSLDPSGVPTQTLWLYRPENVAPCPIHPESYVAGPHVRSAVSGNGWILVTLDSFDQLHVFGVGVVCECCLVHFDANAPNVTGTVDAMELDWSGQYLTIVSGPTNSSSVTRYRLSQEKDRVTFSVVKQSTQQVASDDLQFDTVHVSSEGSTVTFTNEGATEPGNQATARVYSLGYDDQYVLMGQFSFLEPKNDDLPRITFSDDGSTIARIVESPTETSAYTYELLNLINPCGPDEVNVRVASFLPPSNVYSDIWTIISEQTFPKSNTSVVTSVLSQKYPIHYNFYGNADSCGGRSALDFLNGISSDEICIPESELACAHFVSYSSKSRVDPWDTVVSVTQNSTAVVTETLLATGKILTHKLVTDTCREEVAELTCESGETLLSMVLPSYRDETKSHDSGCTGIITYPDWAVLTEAGAILEHTEYHNEPAGVYRAEQRCLDSSLCYALIFPKTFYDQEDLGENGYYWNVAPGPALNYTIWWGDDVVQMDTLSGDYRVSIPFGACSNIFTGPDSLPPSIPLPELPQSPTAPTGGSPQTPVESPVATTPVATPVASPPDILTGTFRLIGQGDCVDSTGKTYDFAATFVNDDKECAETCLGTYQQESSFLGFSFDTSWDACYCAFDNNRQQDPSVQDPFFSSSLEFDGTGLITGVDAVNTFNCYALRSLHPE